MMTANFDRENKAQWAALIKNSFGETPPHSAKWTDPDDMVRVLSPFMGPSLNHVMLPGRGGWDMESVERSPELGCITFVSDERLADMMCRPGVLFFEHFRESPWNSFFLIETKPLAPCGVCQVNDEDREKVVELYPGKYGDPSHHDNGIAGYDEDENEIPLPETTRRLTRHMKGKCLIVAKRSWWNLATATYDGRHNRMTANEIREVIQHAIDQK